MKYKYIYSTYTVLSWVTLYDDFCHMALQNRGRVEVSRPFQAGADEISTMVGPSSPGISNISELCGMYRKTVHFLSEACLERWDCRSNHDDLQCKQYLGEMA